MTPDKLETFTNNYINDCFINNKLSILKSKHWSKFWFSTTDCGKGEDSVNTLRRCKLWCKLCRLWWRAPVDIRSSGSLKASSRLRKNSLSLLRKVPRLCLSIFDEFGCFIFYLKVTNEGQYAKELMEKQWVKQEVRHVPPAGLTFKLQSCNIKLCELIKIFFTPRQNQTLSKDASLPPSADGFILSLTQSYIKSDSCQQECGQEVPLITLDGKI